MPTPPVFLAPRDARTPVVERLEWGTDVQPSRNGTESRVQLRPFPRHTVSFDVLLNTPAARASLSALRQETRFLVPLWQHAFERPADSPDAGICAVQNTCLLLDHSGTAAEVPTPLLWPSWAHLAAPAAIARGVSDQRTIRHVTKKVGTTAVSFQLEHYDEDVAPYAGPTSGGLPLLDVFTTSASSISEQIDIDANKNDTGLLDGLYEARFIKRSFTLTLTLSSRADVLAFRRLLFVLKGRLNPLRWTPPFDDEPERTWRLSADAVELSYLRPGLAQCTLSLMELS
jgi:hypothetical protein